MYQKLKTQYPCLKKGPNGGIVLYTAPRTGTLLTKSTTGLPIGTVSDDWNEPNCIPYNEPVTLQN